MFRKVIRPQFSKFSLAIESEVFWYKLNTADSMARLNFENWGRIIFCYTTEGDCFSLELRVNFAVTLRYTLSTPLWHTYSEPSLHEDLPSIIQNMPYLSNKLSKSRLRTKFFLGVFWLIFEVGSRIYIANLAIFKIWVFSATFWHEITLYAICIDKKRFRTPFFNTQEPLWKSALNHTQLSGTSENESYALCNHIQYKKFAT